MCDKKNSKPGLDYRNPTIQSFDVNTQEPIQLYDTQTFGDNGDTLKAFPASGINDDRRLANYGSQPFDGGNKTMSHIGLSLTQPVLTGASTAGLDKIIGLLTRAIVTFRKGAQKNVIGSIRLAEVIDLNSATFERVVDAAGTGYIDVVKLPAEGRTTIPAGLDVPNTEQVQVWIELPENEVIKAAMDFGFTVILEGAQNL